MPAEFTTRGFRAGDEQTILDLFARSFPHAPRPLAHFDWKYRRNPFGNEAISLTFDDRGALVGHYAGYAVPFVLNGESIVARQIGDTMTEPAIRHVGRGPTSILGRTALDFYARFCEGRVAFNYGFNVANIQRFSLRFLRSDRVEPVTYRTLDARALRPLSRFQRWRLGISFELVTATSAEWDELFARVAPAYRFLVRRDAAYVRWRYLECPDIPYFVIAMRKWKKLVGWIVIRIRENRLTIGDALVDPEQRDVFAIALRHVVPGYPVDLVEGWFPPRPDWFDAMLREIGFESRPEPQDLSLMCVPFTLADATERMRAGLYYTWGDSDLF